MNNPYSEDQAALRKAWEDGFKDARKQAQDLADALQSLISMEDERTQIEDRGYAHNSPIGRKWNAARKAFKQWEQS
jgi:hypothetical protein